MINKVILMGRLGQDPQVRHLENGRKVASFTIATHESLPTAAGPRREITEWHRLEMWDKLAEVAEKYLSKGKILYVEGKIRTDKFVDANGIEKQVKKIRVSSMQLMNFGNKPSPNNQVKNTNENNSNQEEVGDVITTSDTDSEDEF